MRVGYLPDMFGHVAQMPQILRRAGIERAVVWRGVPALIEHHRFVWEAPDGSTVETELWDERTDDSVRIEQVIFVQRPSQRAIVLGEGGQRIKTIGARARAELERMLDRRVHLFLFVKVRENWAEDRQRYSALGLDYDA